MKHYKHQKLLDTIDHSVIIERTTPLILDKRLAKLKNVLDHRIGSIQLVFEQPNDVHNAIAAVRTAEALGIVNIHIINPDNKAIRSKTISQSATYWTNVQYHNSLPDFLSTLPRSPCRLAGAIMDGHHTPSTLPLAHPTYLFFGNEHKGLSQAAIETCDTHFRIPMTGMSESLNLSVAAAITAYELTKRKRILLNGDGDLSVAERLPLNARYHLNSVSKRFLNGLFPEAELN